MGICVSFIILESYRMTSRGMNGVTLSYCYSGDYRNRG